MAPFADGACASSDGDTCETGTGRLLQCINGKWVIFSDCHGRQGCSQNGDTTFCDTTGNTGGDFCAPTSEGRVRCEPDGGTQILQCMDHVLTAIYECEAPKRCGSEDGGLTCVY